MKRLHLSYDMLIEYSEEVKRCNFTIKCIPADTLRQRISNVQIQITPEARYTYGKDGLNNIQIYGANEEPHSSFEIHVEADATTGLCYYEADINDNIDMIFSHTHGLNVPGHTIRAFYENMDINNDLNSHERALLLMNSLSCSFSYVPLSTDVNTSAEEAFTQGHGVCQDYAHIFISLLHLNGLSARYVNGFIVGEGASHAWVEVLCDGKWYGFDPTHNRMINDEYIKLGIGRDAKDCMINRGIMQGGGFHTQKVSVQVNEEK